MNKTNFAWFLPSFLPIKQIKMIANKGLVYQTDQKIVRRNQVQQVLMFDRCSMDKKQQQNYAVDSYIQQI